MTDYMRYYLAMNQVGLGRLVAVVSETDTPRCFCSVPDVDLDDQLRCSKRKWENNDVTLNSSSSSTLRAAITKAGASLFSKQKKAQSHLKFDEGFTYDLLNVYDRFDELLGNTNTVVPWLRKYQQTHDIYLVAAFSTAVGAEVEIDTGRSKIVNLSAPATEMIAPGIGQTLDGEAAEFGLEARNQSSRQAAAKFVAPEERVLCLCYQKVHFRSFFGKKLPSEILSNKGKWVVTDGSRGAAEEEWVVPELLEGVIHDVGTVAGFDTMVVIPRYEDDDSDYI